MLGDLERYIFVIPFLYLTFYVTAFLLARRLFP